MKNSPIGITNLPRLHSSLSLSITCLILVVGVSLASTTPDWWTETSTSIVDSTATDDFAAANVGQLKHVVTQAKSYFETTLGVSTPIWDVAYSSHGGNPFPLPNSDNYAAANVGQLKYLASGFYEILNSIDTFNVATFLTAQGVSSVNYSSGLPVFPWADSTPIGEDYAAINIGQLKLVFSFSVDDLINPIIDLDDDDMSDIWEVSFFGNLNPIPENNFDGDNWSEFEEYTIGMDPLNFDQDSDGNLDGIFKNDLIAFWNFDQHQNNLVWDLSGNGHHMSLPTYSTLKEIGEQTVLGFDSGSSSSSFYNNSWGNSEFSGEFTWSFWIRYNFNSYSNFTLWISSTTSSQNNYIEFSDSDSYYQQTIGETDIYGPLGTFPDAIVDGKWHMLTFSIEEDVSSSSGYRFAFYLDGTFYAEISNVSLMNSSNYEIDLYSTGFYVDDIRIFNRALTSVEISHLRYGLQPLEGNDSTAPTNPGNPLFDTISSASASWDASTDETALNGYIILRNNRPYQFTKYPSFNDQSEGLFTYQVLAFDRNSNISDLVTLGSWDNDPLPTALFQLGYNFSGLEIPVEIGDQLRFGIQNNIYGYVDVSGNSGQRVGRISILEDNNLKQSIWNTGTLLPAVYGPSSIYLTTVGEHTYKAEIKTEWGSTVFSNEKTFTVTTDAAVSYASNEWPRQAVELSASVATNPASITLDWRSSTRPANYFIYRKSETDETWTFLDLLTGTPSNYTDTNVTVGEIYEYKVARLYSGSGGSIAYGYVLSGIEAPLKDSLGKVILIVDETIVPEIGTSLRSEIDRFKEDLIGDGWNEVIEHIVPRDVDAYTSNTDPTPDPAYATGVEFVKSILASEYQNDAVNTRAAILIGRVPVPYSGHKAWDGHTNHTGAWPADIYYGDVATQTGDGLWNDLIDPTYPPPARARNLNRANDGKFDNNQTPSHIELQIGRIDLAEMPNFSGLNELDLLKRYFDKNHAFRYGTLTAGRKGLIDIASGNSFAGQSSPAFANFAATLGWNQVFSNYRNGVDFFGSTVPALNGDSYLLAYGSGGGNYYSAASLFSQRTTAVPSRCNPTDPSRGATCDFADYDPQIAFSILFGSYFGDWNNANSFLRAPLAAQTYGLASFWAADGTHTDPWIFHRLGLGGSIGESFLLSQNNRSTFRFAGAGTGRIVSVLMGDPTLKVLIAPPTEGLDTEITGNTVELTWTSSSDSRLIGYHVYRFDGISNPADPIRLTSVPLSSSTFTDTPLASGDYTYMVRTIILEETGSGSYFNAGQGAFVEITIP